MNSSGIVARPAQTQASETHLKIIEQAMTSDIPRFYANGFVIAYGGSDATLVILNNNVPVGMLQVGYASLKELSENMLHGIERLEDKIGVKFLTAAQLNEKLTALPEAGDK